MTNTSTRKQLANIWQGNVDDLMAMSESEIDAELRELGIEPKSAAEQGKLALDQALARDRASKRAALRGQLEAARLVHRLDRDPSITADEARRRIAHMQAANDNKLTLAARNRNPDDFSDQEALDLFWKIEELKS